MTALLKQKKEHLIVQSNEVTEAAYYLSIKAKRVLWLCLSQAYQSDAAKQGVFTVSVTDYQHYFGVGSVSASKDVRLAVDELLSGFVRFYPKGEEFDEVSRPWLAEQATKKSKGIYQLEFNHKLLPYITGLSEKFTQFYLQHCGKLNNSRTIRLYESLCQWQSTGRWRVDVDWLVQRYDLPQSQANNFAELRRKFLEPAIKRINDNTPLQVSMTERTSEGSNKVDSILFHILSSN
jgi:plasmid replication initiation protein